MKFTPNPPKNLARRERCAGTGKRGDRRRHNRATAPVGANCARQIAKDAAK
jgi:hypothetical protein